LRFTGPISERATACCDDAQVEAVLDVHSSLAEDLGLESESSEGKKLQELWSELDQDQSGGIRSVCPSFSSIFNRKNAEIAPAFVHFDSEIKGKKVVKFISKNAYIMVAMKGYSFCKAAKKSFMLGRFFPLFLRFSSGKCRNCPFFRGF
jgi:hypothetical protein